MSVLCSFESALAGSLAFFNPLDIPTKDYNLYVNTQTLLVNDAFSLKGLFDDFHGRFTSKNQAYTAIGDIRYDIGTYVNDSFYIGYAYREEAIIKTSSDTMKLINQVSNDLDLPIGEKYQIDLAIEGFETHSIVLAKVIPLYHSGLWDITLGLGVEALYGIQTQDGQARGEAEAVAIDDYDFSWQSHYLYTENYLYDLDVTKVTAYGFTTHIAFYLKYDNFSLDIIGNDVFGKLYWKNLPYSDVTLSSGNKSYDENGYVVYSPIVSGFEGSTKYTQELMSKWKVVGQYTLKNNSFKVGVETINTIVLPFIEYTHRYENDIVASVNYETYFHMFGVNIKNDNYYFGIQSNSLMEPSAMKLDLGVHYQF